MNKIFSTVHVGRQQLSKNVPSVSLTVDSGPTDKPAEGIIAILSRQLLQCSRFVTQKKVFQIYI